MLKSGNPDLIREVEESLKILRSGGVILYPTDTVWGLGCDATNREAVEKIYKIKRREDSKSLITLVRDADMICRYVKVVPEVAIQLIEVADKPMTIIYPGVTGLAPNAVAADGSAGMRIPDHEYCSRLLFKFNKPVISTSANISGEPAPALFSEISPEILEAVDYVVKSRFEEGSSGKPSSIIKIGVRGEVEIIRK
jgi:L-threonylcarbamoyladenylate synthase